MEYPNRGALFTTKLKKHEKSPDMFGELKIELDLLRDMLDSAETDHVTIKLDAWLGKDKNGNRMVSMKLNTYKPEAAPAAPGKDPWDD
jgi:hypothetical protein